MATLIPPSPVGVPMGSTVWNQWLETVRQVVNASASGVLWANINFAGSNLTDLATRNHNNLQSIQGGTAGEYYHLTNTQHTRATSVISSTTDPTTATIAASQWAIYKNTTSGLVKLWVNDGGTMKSVTLT